MTKHIVKILAVSQFEIGQTSYLLNHPRNIKQHSLLAWSSPLVAHMAQLHVRTTHVPGSYPDV